MKAASRAAGLSTCCSRSTTYCMFHSITEPSAALNLALETSLEKPVMPSKREFRNMYLTKLAVAHHVEADVDLALDDAPALLLGDGVELVEPVRALRGLDGDVAGGVEGLVGRDEARGALQAPDLLGPRHARFVTVIDSLLGRGAGRHVPRDELSARGPVLLGGRRLLGLA